MPELKCLLDAREFLAENHTDQITLAMASQVAAYSPYHFQRLFSNTFGESPQEFVQRLRFERARDLLINSDQPVQDICFLVGYNSPASFNRIFKSRTGITPLEFRKKARLCFHVGRWRTPSFIPLCMAGQAPAPEN